MAETEPAGLPVVVRRLTQPFPVWVCETGAAGIALSHIPGPNDSMWRLAGLGAVYENDCERGKRTTRDLNRLPAGVDRLLAWLRSEAMIKMWSELTGIEGLIDDNTLHGSGLHVVAGGGWLNTHLDYARHPLLDGYERRVNLILFLNPDWNVEWGGAFEVCRPDGSVAERIYPSPGRLIVFETSDLSYHGTQASVPDAPDRISLAGYYLASASPSATRVRALFMPNRR